MPVKAHLDRQRLDELIERPARMLDSPVADQVIFDERPTRRTSVAQGLFFGGSRAVAQTHQADPKNASGPSAFL